MSNENKYGKEELLLAKGVIEAYKDMGETFILMNSNNTNYYALQQKFDEKKQKYIFIDERTFDYLKFTLDKILKDNFDEEFIKEKIKK